MMEQSRQRLTNGPIGSDPRCRESWLRAQPGPLYQSGRAALSGVLLRWLVFRPRLATRALVTTVPRSSPPKLVSTVVGNRPARQRPAPDLHNPRAALHTAPL